MAGAARLALVVGTCGAIYCRRLFSLDEIHQAFVASRTASPYDSLLDSIGATFAVVTLFLWFRLRTAPANDLNLQQSL